MPLPFIPWPALTLGLTLLAAVAVGPVEACELQQSPTGTAAGCRDMGRFEPPAACQHLSPVARCARREGASAEATARRRAVRPGYLPLVIVGTSN